MASYSRVNGDDASRNSQFPETISFSTPQQARQRQAHISDEEKGLIARDHQGNYGQQKYSHISEMVDNKGSIQTFWDRFSRKGKRKVGVIKSLRNLALSSWINILLLLIPVAWVAHFKQEDAEWGHRTVFALALLAIIPLEHLFEYGGDQMRCYLGKDLGDLVVITLNNAVEATLGIILLLKCELVLLKSTIIGVIILHLLLVPGIAFIMGGARIIQQDLHPHLTQLNQSTLTVGVLTLLLPFAIFTALNSSFNPSVGEVISAVNDEVRGKILQLSRGLAVLLLLVYVCSRIYLHNPPGEDNAMALHLAPNAPEALKHEAELFRQREPEVNQWVCIIMLLAALGLMAPTAEWLVESLEPIREEGNIRNYSEIWFGLILLPLVSFAADGILASVYFVRHLLRHFFTEPVAPTTLAQSESIDLSIQFVLFWMPLYVLIGWFSGRPLTLLFDIFEVALVIGSCFLINYITADSKTNWAEGAAMVIFYVMIALATWFYDGQPEIKVMSTCESIATTIAALVSGGGGEDLTSAAHR